jgi:hypothetical protein
MRNQTLGLCTPSQNPSQHHNHEKMNPIRHSDFVIRHSLRIRSFLPMPLFRHPLNRPA